MRVRLRSGSARPSARTRRRASATRLGQRLERRQRATGDRPREPAVDDPRQPGQPRREVVLDLDVTAGRGRLDAPGHVHAARRAGDVDEPESAGRGLRPGPRAPGRPAGRCPARDERPRATKSTTSDPSARAARGPRPGVVGEQPLPALDVVGEGEDQRRRRSDVDADRGVHRSSSWRQQRGEEARVQRAAGRDEIAHHEAHRRTDGVARCDPPGGVFEQPGRARNAWTSQETASLARNRRVIARS